MLIITPYYNYYNLPIIRTNHDHAVKSLLLQGFKVVTVEAYLRGGDPVIQSVGAGHSVRTFPVDYQLFYFENLFNAVYRDYDEEWYMLLDSGVMLDIRDSFDRFYLSDYDAVRVYHSVTHLRCDGVPMTRRQSTLPDCRNTDGSWDGSCSPGFGWLYNRKYLGDAGLYDKCIVGGADIALLAHLTGCYHPAIRTSTSYYSGIHSWIAEHPGQFKVCDADNTVIHLWHGDLGGRAYSERVSAMDDIGYDSARDISYRSDGIIELDGTSPVYDALVAYTEEYFRGRASHGV